MDSNNTTQFISNNHSTVVLKETYAKLLVKFSFKLQKIVFGPEDKNLKMFENRKEDKLYYGHGHYISGMNTLGWHWCRHMQILIEDSFTLNFFTKNYLSEINFKVSRHTFPFFQSITFLPEQPKDEICPHILASNTTTAEQI